MKNPIKGTTKAYGNLQLTGVVTINELADHMAEHNTVFSKGTIVGVLSDLGACLRELILQGYKIDLGDIGTFAPTIASKGAASIKEFTQANITKMGVNFKPGYALQGLLRDAEFEQTTSRAAQAAALKAQKEGLTTADWTPEAEDGGEEGNDEP